MDDLGILVPLLLEVKVVTPIHIGTGDKLSRKAFFEDGRNVIVVDDRKLIDWASADEKRVYEFMEFMERPERPEQGLADFLRRHSATPESFAAYQMRQDAPSRPRDILQFIKTSENRPYLPGSSLKGSLGSALARGYLAMKPAQRDIVAQAVRPIVREKRRDPGGEADAAIFVPKRDVKRGKRPNYTLMRAFGLGDSRSVSATKLEVAEVRVLSAQTDQTLRFKQTPRGDHVMQIFAEMLKPDTVLFVPLTLNWMLLDDKGPAAELGLRPQRQMVGSFWKYARAAADDLLQQELRFYEQHHQAGLAEQCRKLQERSSKLPDYAFLLRIGWGGGYDAKTITDQLSEDIFRMTVENYRNTHGLGKPGGSGRWLGPELSPKSRKVVYHGEDNVAPIGWLEIRARGR